jgi:hypothetical protein
MWKCLRRISGRIAFAQAILTRVIHGTSSFDSHLVIEAIRALINLAFIYLCLLTIITVHELAHLVVGKACAFKVIEFRVGVIRWLKETGWAMCWRRSFLFTGMVTIHPTSADRYLRLRYLVFILAGPIANIGIGLLAFAPGRAHSAFEGFVRLLAFGSFVIGIINLFPAKGKGLKTDGLRAIEVISAKGFRELRFRTAYLDATDELLGSLRQRDFIGAKRICEVLLSLASGIPEGDAALQALHTVLALSNRGIPFEPHSAPTVVEHIES